MHTGSPAVDHIGSTTSTFTYTVVAFVLLMVFFKMMASMKDEQKGSTRYRHKFLRPDAPRSQQRETDADAKKNEADSTQPPGNKS
jgi:hypothetical protein